MKDKHIEYIVASILLIAIANGVAALAYIVYNA